MADRFVRTSGGSDSNGGTSVGDGWATMTHAEANTFTLNFPGTEASGNIQWSGANGSGVVDGTLAIVDAGASGDAIRLNSGLIGAVQSAPRSIAVG